MIPESRHIIHSLTKGRLTMYKKQLDDMTKGWFIGNFEPSLMKTNDVEVAVKHY